LMEWSLSIDNIFVFILIFSFFKIHKEFYGRVLLLGILGAIIFRVIFITIGIALLQPFPGYFTFLALSLYTPELKCSLLNNTRNSILKKTRSIYF
jgi:tellurite resistance protein TerC